MQDRLISVTEAKQQLCVGTTTIYELMKSGQLPKLKVGRRTLFRASDIQDFIQRRAAEAALAAA